MGEPGVWHQNVDEYALASAVGRARELLKVLDVEHHPTDLYKALRGVRFELDSMAGMLPRPGVTPTPPAGPEMAVRPRSPDVTELPFQ